MTPSSDVGHFQIAGMKTSTCQEEYLLADWMCERECTHVLGILDRVLLSSARLLCLDSMKTGVIGPVGEN